MSAGKIEVQDKCKMGIWIERDLVMKMKMEREIQLRILIRMKMTITIKIMMSER